MKEESIRRHVKGDIEDAALAICTFNEDVLSIQLQYHRSEALKGDRLGQLSVRINDQLRICFAWNNGEVHSVEIIDYHR